MRLITEEEKKELLVDLLVRLDAFCRENGIEYWVTAGTLLGTIRHKGFIPWDDDIDLAMPRADFLRLIHCLEESREELQVHHMELVSFDERRKSYHKKFKIADTRTMMQEYGKVRPAVFIDVFPIDCISAGMWHNLHIKGIQAVDNLLVLSYSGDISARGLKGIVYKLILGLNQVLGLERMIKLYESALLRINQEQESRVGSVKGNVEGSYGEREYVPQSCWSGKKLLPFEDIMVPVPMGYDRILTSLYGDYMTPPPPEKRHNHSYYQMYWKD